MITNLLRDYYRFFTQHKPTVGFGLNHAFFAGFGQTFLIALFVPQLQSLFQLSPTEFGAFYSAATLINALLLSWVGSKIDHVPLRRFSTLSFLLFLSSIFGCAFSTGQQPNLYLFFLSMIGLRLGGQGLMTHIAATSMARIFDKDRGKALGISTLGHPLGEAILAPLLALILGFTTVQQGFFFMAACLLFLYAPLNFFLLKHLESHDAATTKTSQPQTKHEAKASPECPPKSRREIFFSLPYMSILPAYILPPFILTGLFLHQGMIAQQKGWDASWLAQCFTAFALSRILASFLVGPLIDKWNARSLFPWYLLPIGLGVILLMTVENRWIALFYLAGGGITVGSGSNLKSAMLAEVFGKRSMGTARSLSATAVAMGTAVSPLAFGWMIDHNYLEYTLQGIVAIIVLTTMLNLVLTRRIIHPAEQFET